MFKAVGKAMFGLSFMTVPVKANMSWSLAFFLVALYPFSSLATELVVNDQSLRGPLSATKKDDLLLNVVADEESHRGLQQPPPPIFTFSPDAACDKLSSWALIDTVSPPCPLTGGFGQSLGPVTIVQTLTKTVTYSNCILEGAAATNSPYFLSLPFTELPVSVWGPDGEFLLDTTTEACTSDSGTTTCLFDFGEIPDLPVPPSSISTALTWTLGGRDILLTISDPIAATITTTGVASVNLTNPLGVTSPPQTESTAVQVQVVVSCPNDPTKYTEGSNYKFSAAAQFGSVIKGFDSALQLFSTDSSVNVPYTCSAIPPNIHICDVSLTGEYPLTGVFKIVNTSDGDATSVKVGTTTVTVYNVNKYGVTTVRGTCSTVTSTGATVPAGAAASTFAFSSCKDSKGKALKYEEKYTRVEIVVAGPSTKNQDNVAGPSAGWKSGLITIKREDK